MKQITIFGATGFIGHHLVRRLAKTGATLRIATLDAETSLTLKPMGDVGQIVPIYCSTQSDAQVREAIGSSDVVINLIGALIERGPNTFQAVHIEAAARIARLSREQNVKRLLHVSALGADIRATSHYARSKGLGEQGVRTFFPGATIFRPSLVFGPEDKLFNKFAVMAKYLPFLPLIGGGVTQFQPVYVGDVAEAMMVALQRPDTAGVTYELGGPQIYNFRQLMMLVLHVTGRRNRLVNIPWGLAKIQAAMCELLPVPPLTCDQVELLRTDNIITDQKARTLRDLDITPTALETILPTYLNRFKKVRHLAPAPVQQ